MDTTPLWLIAIFAVLAILLWIALELRHQRKSAGQSHYEFYQTPITDYPQKQKDIASDLLDSFKPMSVEDRIARNRKFLEDEINNPNNRIVRLPDNDPYAEVWKAIEKEDL